MQREEEAFLRDFRSSWRMTRIGMSSDVDDFLINITEKGYEGSIGIICESQESLLSTSLWHELMPVAKFNFAKMESLPVVSDDYENLSNNSRQADIKVQDESPSNDEIQEKIDETQNQVESGLSSVGDAIAEKASTTKNKVEGGLSSVGQTFKEKGNDAANFIAEKSGLGMYKAGEAIESGAVAAGHKIGNLGTATKEATKSGLYKTGEAIESGASSTGSYVVEKLSDAATNFEEMAGSKMESMGQKLREGAHDRK